MMSDYLSTKEAADLAGVTPRTLYNWSRRGWVKLFRAGGQGAPRYRRDQVVEAARDQMMERSRNNRKIGGDGEGHG